MALQAAAAAAAGGPATRMRCMYVFNRKGVCVHYHVWLRPLSTLSRQEDQKLMFGLLFSLRSFTAKMDPVGGNKGQLGATALQGQGCSFHSFRTNSYKLSFMETPTGIKIVLLTDPRMGDLREALRYIYSNIYVEYVVKNSLYTPDMPFRYGLQSKPYAGIQSIHSARGSFQVAFDSVCQQTGLVMEAASRCELFNSALDSYVKTLS